MRDLEEVNDRRVRSTISVIESGSDRVLGFTFPENFMQKEHRNQHVNLWL